MSRILFIHWNAAEAEQRAARLRAAGYEVAIHADPTNLDRLRAAGENPPEVFVFDLGRLPSHGREVAAAMRRQKATRHVPIVFVGGEPDKVAATRRLLPDAVYAEWSAIRGALRKALRNRPTTPVVPGVMAGYSGTPLPKKLGIKSGSVVALLGAPADFERTLGKLPDGVRLQSDARGSPDRILLFAKTRADLARRFPGAARALAEGGGLWIAWPKKASGVESDLAEPAVRAFGLDAGWVDYKICAIDQTWSGLLFARRRPVRALH